MDYEGKYQDYVKLLRMTYAEAVEYLLSKYGPVKENYFKEEGYEKFLAGINKTLTKQGQRG